MWKKTEEENMNNTNSGSNNMLSEIGPKSITVGEIKGGEDLLILGVLDGTINLEKNTVTVGKTGMVKGKINSVAIMVEGKVEGDLRATGRIILRSSAKVTGDIISSTLVMEDGCFFKGTIDMIVESAKSLSPPNTNNKTIVKKK